MFIIDPPQGRPPADEMVLVMGAYDIDGDQQNDLYAFNGIPTIFGITPSQFINISWCGYMSLI